MNPPGSFYYLTPCIGFSKNDMPFEVIGTHARWEHEYTILDYLTVKLCDNNGDEYYVKVSGEDGVLISDDDSAGHDLYYNILCIV